MGGQGQSRREEQRKRGRGAHVEADRRGSPQTATGAQPVPWAGSEAGFICGQSVAASADPHASPPASRRRYPHRCRVVRTQPLWLSTREVDTCRNNVKLRETSTLGRHYRLSAMAATGHLGQAGLHLPSLPTCRRVRWGDRNGQGRGRLASGRIAVGGQLTASPRQGFSKLGADAAVEGVGAAATQRDREAHQSPHEDVFIAAVEP